MTEVEMTWLDYLLNLDDDSLSDWELMFIESLANRPEGYSLSEKQHEKLEELYEKH